MATDQREDGASSRSLMIRQQVITAKLFNIEETASNTEQLIDTFANQERIIDERQK